MGFKQDAAQLCQRLLTGDKTAVADTARQFNFVVPLWVRDFTGEDELNGDLAQEVRHKILLMAQRIADGRDRTVTNLSAWLKRGVINRLIDYVAEDTTVKIPRTSRKRMANEELAVVEVCADRDSREDAMRRQLREQSQTERFGRNADKGAEEQTNIADMRYADNRKNHRGQRLGIKRHNGRPMRRDRKLGEMTLIDIIIDRGKTIGLRCNDANYINGQIWRRFQKKHPIDEIAWHFNLKIEQVRERLAYHVALVLRDPDATLVPNNSEIFRNSPAADHVVAV